MSRAALQLSPAGPKDALILAGVNVHYSCMPFQQCSKASLSICVPVCRGSLSLAVPNLLRLLPAVRGQSIGDRVPPVLQP